MTKNKTISTFERLMQDQDFKEKYECEHRKTLLSELMLSLMEEDEKSVRKLAHAIGLSPTVIQKIRSGKQEDIKMSNFINIVHACGYHLVLEKGAHRISL